MTKATTDHRRLRPIAGLKALLELLGDPEDTSRVFAVIEAFTGRSNIEAYRRFAADVRGQELLAQKPEILSVLGDRRQLEAFPKGSLGHAYLQFMDSEGIDAVGLVEAATEHPDFADPDHAWLQRRMRDTHDLWHVVCGYQGDLVGEAALLGFTYAQTGNLGIGLIALGGMHQLPGHDTRRTIIGGYLRGRRADWLPSAQWEELLPLPLHAVRQTLRVGAPPNYRTLRPGDFTPRWFQAARAA